MKEKKTENPILTVRQRLARNSRKRRTRKYHEAYLPVILIIGLAGSCVFVPIFLSYIFKDSSGSFITTGIFSMISLAIVFWSWIQTIKNTKIKGADELEKQLNQAISTAKLDMAGVNRLQDREIRDLGEAVKNVDGLTSILDIRLQESNKRYVIFIKLIKIIQYLEYLDKCNEDVAEILENTVLNRKFPSRNKPPKIDASDLNW